MLPVAGRPIVGHILADVERLGPEEVRLVVGYMGDRLEEYAIQAFPDLPVRCVWQKDQLGLGHAVLQALDEEDTGPALVILGDTVFDVDYEDFVEGGDHTLGVRRVPDPERFGIVELNDDEKTIIRLVEKPREPKGDLALVGLYYIRAAERLREVLTAMVDEGTRTRGEIQLTDALQRMIDAGETLVPYEIGGWFDCGKPETLLQTNRALLELRGGTEWSDGENAVVVPPVAIDPTCTVENAVVGPFVTLCAEVTVRDSVIRDAIVGSGASIRGAVVEGSIIGPDAIVDGRSKEYNLGHGSTVQT
jgi:glucose-1-phosphate thymidylyltransferase